MVVASRVAIAAAAGAAAAAIWHAYYRRKVTALEPRMTSEEQRETTNVEPARPNEPEPTIEKLSDDILALLKKYKPVEVDGMDPALHYLAPHVPKVRWTELGDLVAGREKATFGAVDGARWMTLRLDGCGFSKAVRLMRKEGVLEPSGFSAIFAETMVSCLRLLLEHFNGAIGYTQSDEMVIFIPPASIVRGEQQGHARNGRVTKIATLAASLCTAHFVMELSGRCITAGVGLEGLSQLLPHFDCRVGSFSSWEEARSLLLWRAYDCSVNGVSDAVYHTPGSGKAIQNLGKREKIGWLYAHGHLPLPRHQAYGTVIVKVKRKVDGHNPKTGTTVATLRGVYEQVDGPVLELARRDALFPKDDELA